MFLLHTTLITVGLSRLTARGAIVCTFPVDYLTIQMLWRSTQQAVHHSPIQEETTQGTGRQRVKANKTLTVATLEPVAPAVSEFKLRLVTSFVITECIIFTSPN